MTCTPPVFNIKLIYGQINADKDESEEDLYAPNADKDESEEDLNAPNADKDESEKDLYAHNADKDESEKDLNNLIADFNDSNHSKIVISIKYIYKIDSFIL